MILVTGATGNVGRELVRTLVERGEPVRALIRREADRARLAPGVDAAVGDLDRPDSLTDAVEGVRAAHLLSGYADMPGLLKRLRQAGAERVTLQSSSAVPTGDMTNAVARYHIESEAAVRDSGLAWTFLQPNSFMSNTLQWVPQLRAGDVIRAPFADVPIATIDPLDIAAVAADALTTAAHEGRSYRLSGPESLRPPDRVAILATVLDRDLRFAPQSNEEARAEMSAAMPEQYVDAFFSFFVDGTVDESTVLPTVREVLGREPRTFEQWARARRAARLTAMRVVRPVPAILRCALGPRAQRPPTRC
jgi:uncharacterized protein YbjT (DUF2867 family)